MFHTASSDVIITEDAFARLKTIKFSGTVDSVQSWGGNINSSDFSKNNLLEIGNLSWNNITIWKDKNSGQETNGKIGLNLFENKILEFDFNTNLVTVETIMPRKIKKYDKLKLLSKDDDMFIRAICQVANDTFVNYFLIHSGYGGSVLLDDKFVSESKIDKQINIIGEKKLIDAFGNVLTTKKGILPIFKIGKHQLTNVPAGFFEGAIGRQKMSIIGGDILKRFNWIIDAKREYIYLKPNISLRHSFLTFELPAACSLFHFHL